jgi:hypothetical protein
MCPARVFRDAAAGRSRGSPSTLISKTPNNILKNYPFWKIIPPAASNSAICIVFCLHIHSYETNTTPVSSYNLCASYFRATFFS